MIWWSIECLDIQKKVDRPITYFDLTLPESITTRIPGIVSEVSAKFVATTIFRVFSGGISNDFI